MNITKKQLTVLCKVAKGFKSNTVFILNDNVMDLQNNIILSYVKIPFSLGQVMYMVNNLLDVNELLPKDGILEFDINTGNLCIGNNPVIYNIISTNTINTNLLSSICAVSNMIPYISIPDIRLDPTFEIAINSPSNVIYKIKDNFMISIFKGLLPINKSDKVGINIILSDENTFICNFVIDKKSYIQHVYIRYIYLTK